MRMPAGNTADCIVVENDGAMRETAFEPADYTGFRERRYWRGSLTPEVTGMGGAGFPTHVKLSPKEPGENRLHTDQRSRV